MITEEQYDNLTQGDKIKFMWRGNGTLEYTGRIELNKFGEKYFVNESNYKGGLIPEHLEGMRFYNSLMPYYDFTMLEIIK